MYLFFLVLAIFGITQEATAIATTAMKRKITLSERVQADFGNRNITLTPTEYSRLLMIPTLEDYINDDRTVMTKDLFDVLSRYTLSRPKVMCIRAPCPRSSTLIIRKDAVHVEIPLTNSTFSYIIDSLNI